MKTDLADKFLAECAQRDANNEAFMALPGEIRELAVELKAAQLALFYTLRHTVGMAEIDAEQSYNEMMKRERSGLLEPASKRTG